MRGWLGTFIATAAWAGLVPAAWAQAGIYTCIDAKGHRLTSDRPIIDCIDREQTELSAGGKVVRKIPPSLTAEERAVEEEKQRKVLDEKARAAEEKRKDRALLARFPDRATHDRERASALRVVDDVIEAANRRVAELATQRKKLDADLEFYKGDKKQVPAQLTRQVEGNESQAAAQKRFIANQEEEKKRVNARFDEDLARLNRLWAQRGSNVAAARAASTAASAAPRAPKAK